ncbi:MAG: hypothetical protein B7Z66_13290 [Chromatiales bacterium 21-64-14]|nr:MAG: hypothetical protein B7Z66_13290 [Chromatiales bacterium 21-64-14]HQU17117.1 hypothetical protein [Gammaproteobacteria bacterium]
MDLVPAGALGAGALSLGLGLDLFTAFWIGMLHGITPDEHTWPITFSYSVGSYSRKGGMRAGFLFSATFAVQRALACELAYFALLDFIHHPRWNFYIYIIVGAVMAASGWYTLRRGRVPHLFHGAAGDAADPKPIPGYMPLVHGFIAGWGTGGFALILYTVLAPATGSPYLAFLPGLLFGLGTMVAQMLLGWAFGAWMARRRLPDAARAYVAHRVAGRTLAGGGLAFVLVGAAGLADPAIGAWGIATGLNIPNLSHVDVGFFLAVVVLFSVAAYAFISALREIRAAGEC